MRFVSSTISLLIVCALALALAACGGSDSSSGDDSLASLAPAGTPFYAEFTTQPNDDQKATLESLISRFGSAAGIDPNTDFDQAIQDVLDQAAAADDSDLEVSYADDIQSWLGAKGAFWIPDIPQDYDSQPDSVNTPAAFIVESTDDDAAQAFIDKAVEAGGGSSEKKEIDGIDAEVGSDGTGALGLDDGYLIIASTDDAFSAAVDARDGDSLADDDDFDSSFEPLSDETLASAYIDPQPFVEMNSDIDPAELDQFNQLFPDLLDSPIDISLAATTDSISLDFSSGAGDAPSIDSESLDGVPGDALAAIAFGDVGEQLSKSIDQLQSIAESSGETQFDPDQIDQALEAQTGFTLSDLEDTLGATDLYVSGQFPSDYVVGIQVGLKQDASELADKLKQAIQQAPQNGGAKIGPSLTGDEGFSLQLPPQTDPSDVRYVDFVFDSDQATILAGPSKEAITGTSTSGSLTDSDAFNQVTDNFGGDFAPVAFADFGPIVDAIDASGGATDPSGQMVLDFLRDQASYLALGVGSEGGSVRATLGLQPDSGQ